MSEQLTTANPTSIIDQALARLTGALSGQVLMSQDQCVDGLLDLFNAAPNELVRELVAGIINSIRHLSAVRAEEILSQLDEVSAALTVELAFS